MSLAILSPEPFVVPARHRGPPESGNGGIVGGRLAAHLPPGPVEVTLRAPTPLERPLEVRRTADGVELRDGDVLIASARPGNLDIVPPPPPTWDEALAASRVGGSNDTSEFNKCFVCGRGLAPVDGLGVWAAPVPGRDLVAAALVADPSHAGPDGYLPDELLWAAIDCPGAIAAEHTPSESEGMLTGRMVGEVTGRIRAGERAIVVGWALGSEGRKRFSGSAIFNEAGEVCARARITWIVLRTD